MRERPARAPGAETWTDALLTSDSEVLIGAVRNYLGPVRTPYDKRELARRLGTFLRRGETRDRILGLLDRLDARILGSCLLLGPAPEQSVKELFAGELPLFELGVRISNLLDRLLLFRYAEGGKRLLAANPLLEASLRERVLDPELLFGPVPPAPVRGGGGEAGREAASGGRIAAGEAADPGEGSAAGAEVAAGKGDAAGVCDAVVCVAFFCFLFHAPGSLRKGGGIGKRAAERFVVLFPGFAAAPGRLDALARAFAASGALRLEGEEWRADRGAFAALLERWGTALPEYFAAVLAELGDEAAGDRGLAASPEREDLRRRAADLGGLLAAALPAAALPTAGEPRDGETETAGGGAEGAEGGRFSRAGFARWLRIASRRASFLGDPARALPALEALGLLGSGPLLPGFLPPPAEAGKERPGPVLVAEGAHALHLMPEAGLADRFLVGCLASLVGAGRVWSYDLERETARRAFAAGLGAAELRRGLEALARRPLPQSLVFSLDSWEEEYRSLRLYRGYVLVADGRLRPIVEGARGLVAETLAPGVYFLAAEDGGEAEAEIRRAGLESPPVVEPPAQAPAAEAPELAAGSEAVQREGRGPAEGEGPEPRAAGGRGPAGSRPSEAIRGLLGELGAARGPAPALDPGPMLDELREALAGAVAEGRRTADEAKELSERIERRLVVEPRQVAEADLRPERMEAAGLDYLGKVRVIERALRSPGDRLEMLYRLPGAEPVRAFLRPVRLDKNDKGLVLEAEDLATGGPARVPLGAVSTVRRVRASLFGEGT